MVDATISILQKALEMRMRAHEIHASNIANANVPNFKAKKLDFEGRLSEAMSGLQNDAPLIEREGVTEQSVKEVAPDIYEDPLAVPSGDGNTVNSEREQTELAKNTIAYEGAIQLISKKFALQKFVLGEGGR